MDPTRESENELGNLSPFGLVNYLILDKHITDATRLEFNVHHSMLNLICRQSQPLLVIDALWRS